MVRTCSCERVRTIARAPVQPHIPYGSTCVRVQPQIPNGTTCGSRIPNLGILDPGSKWGSKNGPPDLTLLRPLLSGSGQNGPKPLKYGPEPSSTPETPIWGPPGQIWGLQDPSDLGLSGGLSGGLKRAVLHVKCIHLGLQGLLEASRASRASKGLFYT